MIWMSPFLVLGISGEYFHFIVFCINIEISVSNKIEISVSKNSEDPVQTPRSVASELGLPCLHMAPKRVSSLKSVLNTKKSLKHCLTELS